MSETQHQIIETGQATGILPVRSGEPITVIGTKKIRDGFDQKALQQAINSRTAPGVTQLVLNPDAHTGYGAPVGCVMVSPTHVFPGPVGVDIKCSMSLLQFDLPADEINAPQTRRALINAILERTPTGAGQGQRSVQKSRKVDKALGRTLSTRGASEEVLRELGIPEAWAKRCETHAHTGHDGSYTALDNRLEEILDTRVMPNFVEKMMQLGSYGGGNHFGECEVVSIDDNDRAREAASVFGMRDNHVAFLSHCGSRGFGNILAQRQFKTLQKHFEDWAIPLPGNDRELVYAPLGSPEADAYLDDMALGANFATVNHMLINALVLEAFAQVFPGIKGELVYFISHNIAQKEVVDNQEAWVHRKGATRAFPKGHFALKGTAFYDTGHPILLPGNPRDGSVVMVADEGAAKSCYSVNHGAGRAMGRRDATRRLDQKTVDAEFVTEDILYNGRQYPIDEAPAAYKDFSEVLRSVKEAGLATQVAKLKARFVIKDNGAPADD